MEENQRYGEEKKLGDIINDMGLGQENTTIQNKKFLDAIMQNLTSYSIRIEKLHPFYVQASKLITEMDNFFLKEKECLLYYKKLNTEGNLSKSDLRIHIQQMETNRDRFEHRENNIRRKLKGIITTFSNQEDSIEHNQKSNDFCVLFAQVYTDIDTIWYEYQMIIKKIK